MSIVVKILSAFDDAGVRLAQSGIRDVDESVKKSKSQSFFGAMEKAALPAAAALTAIGGAAVAFAKEAGGAAKANKKLEASFRANGYEKQAKAAEDYALSLSRKIGVEDEEIKGVMQKLAAFDKIAKSERNMARATAAAADMSAAGFGTMESAATALGKAISNPEKALGALTRMGVTFTKEQEEQIKKWVKTGNEASATNAILEQVEKTFGGVAEASAGGGAKMEVAADQMKEALGKNLAPVLGNFFKMMTNIFNFIGEHSDVFVALAGAVAVFAAAIIGLATAYKVYTIAQNIATIATKVFGRAIATSAIGWILLLVAAVVFLAILIIKNWDKILAWTKKVWGAISAFLSRIWSNIVNWAKSTWDKIVNFVKKGWDIIKKVLSFNPFIMIITHFDKIKAAIGNVVQWIVDKVTWLWDKVTAIFDKIGSTVSNIVDKINPFSSAVAVEAVPSPMTAALARGVGAEQDVVAVRRGGEGGGVNITVNGALDPESVARQITALLDRHNMRNGRAVVRAPAW